MMTVAMAAAAAVQCGMRSKAYIYNTAIRMPMGMAMAMVAMGDTAVMIKGVIIPIQGNETTTTAAAVLAAAAAEDERTHIHTRTHTPPESQTLPNLPPYRE
jgi:hypothetical protein